MMKKTEKKEQKSKKIKKKNGIPLHTTPAQDAKHLPTVFQQVNHVFMFGF